MIMSASHSCCGGAYNRSLTKIDKEGADKSALIPPIT